MEWQHVVAFSARVGGQEVFVRQHPQGWEVSVNGMCHLIRNRRYRTWLTARPVVERVVRAEIEGAPPLHGSGQFGSRE